MRQNRSDSDIAFQQARNNVSQCEHSQAKLLQATAPTKHYPPPGKGLHLPCPPPQLLLQPKYLNGSAATTLTAGHCVHAWSRMSLVTLPPGYTQYPTPQVGPQVVLVATPEVMIQQDLPNAPQSGLLATHVPWGQ